MSNEFNFYIPAASREPELIDYHSTGRFIPALDVTA